MLGLTAPEGRERRKERLPRFGLGVLAGVLIGLLTFPLFFVGAATFVYWVVEGGGMLLKKLRLLP